MTYDPLIIWYVHPGYPRVRVWVDPTRTSTQDVTLAPEGEAVWPPAGVVPAKHDERDT